LVLPLGVLLPGVPMLVLPLLRLVQAQQQAQQQAVRQMTVQTSLVPRSLHLDPEVVALALLPCSLRDHV
jgi:hypothetical protein